jgi:hypothetical protein
VKKKKSNEESNLIRINPILEGIQERYLQTTEKEEE